MERRLEYFSQDIITEKERKMVDRVLEQYDFKVIDFAKVKTVYKVKTDKGNVCLKRIRRGKHKPYNGSILVKELTNKGFFYTAKYYKTKNNDNFVKYKKIIFYATEWIEGQECDLNNIEEAVNCIKLLAQYHLAVNDIDARKFKVKNNLKNWPKIFNENLQDFETFQNLINKKRIKTEFDIDYFNYIENMSCRGLIALNFLNTSQYYRISKEAEKNKTICHDSFYYQNIIKKNNKYYIVNLDSITIDIHVNDLGKLIRKLMFKKSYRWDFDKAKLLIEAYNSVSKLNKSELEVMLALIIFPYKFWKLGRRRYVKHKNWDESKYMRKLTRIIRYNDMQEQFLQDYLSYLKCYI